MIKADLRRAFGGAFVLALTLYAAQYVLGIVQEIHFGGFDAIVCFENARLYNYLIWVTPVLSALPYARGFVQDWNSGYTSALLVRQSHRRYAASKWFSCALAGGLASAAGLMLFLLVLFLLPGAHTQYYRQTFMNLGGMTAMLVELDNVPLYMAGLALLCGLDGALYATAALAFSAYCPNACLTLCFPMLVHRADRLIVRALALPEWLNFGLLVEGQLGLSFEATLAMGLKVYIPLIVLCGALFALGVRRRLEHG